MRALLVNAQVSSDYKSSLLREYLRKVSLSCHRNSIFFTATGVESLALFRNTLRVPTLEDAGPLIADQAWEWLLVHSLSTVVIVRENVLSSALPALFVPDRDERFPGESLWEPGH